jgi:hypothetical protein
MGHGGARVGAGNPSWKPKLSPQQRDGIGRWCEDLFERERDALVDARLEGLPRRQRVAEKLEPLKSMRDRGLKRISRIPSRAQRDRERRALAVDLERQSAEADKIGRHRRKKGVFARSFSVPVRRPKGVRTKIIQRVMSEANEALERAGRSKISLETVRRCWIEFRRRLREISELDRKNRVLGRDQPRVG